MTVTALVPIAFFGLTEATARIDFQLRHGYSYREGLGYVADPDLVFRRNAEHYAWRGRTSSLPILSPSVTRPDSRPVLWVLGGSTSEPLPDQTDWPAVVQRQLTGVRVINMAVGGYGTSQMIRLYRRYEREVKPDAVVVFEGWNGRGAATSPYGWYPVNTVSPFSTLPQRISAALMNWSVFYGRLWHGLDSLKSVPCRAPSASPEEMSAWSKEYEDLVQEISRVYPTHIVLFPGLAMRDDAQDALRADLQCVAVTWPAQRQYYEERVAAIRDIASRHRLQPLDAAQAYRALPVRIHVSYFRDVAHQTVHGNEFLGATIATVLLERGLPAKGAEPPDTRMQRTGPARGLEP